MAVIDWTGSSRQTKWECITRRVQTVQSVSGAGAPFNGRERRKQTNNIQIDKLCIIKTTTTIKCRCVSAQCILNSCPTSTRGYLLPTASSGCYFFCQSSKAKKKKSVWAQMTLFVRQKQKTQLYPTFCFCFSHRPIRPLHYLLRLPCTMSASVSCLNCSFFCLLAADCLLSSLPPRQTSPLMLLKWYEARAI